MPDPASRRLYYNYPHFAAAVSDPCDCAPFVVPCWLDHYYPGYNAAVAFQQLLRHTQHLLDTVRAVPPVTTAVTLPRAWTQLLPCICTLTPALPRALPYTV